MSSPSMDDSGSYYFSAYSEIESDADEWEVAQLQQELREARTTIAQKDAAIEVAHITWMNLANCEFRANRSTIDMIFSLRQLQEKCREQNMPLYIAFIDLTKAFDISLIEPFHTNTKGTVLYSGNLSEPFNIRGGVKQGCVLAPTLFGIFFALLLKQAFGTATEGIYLRTRCDGRLFNLNRLKAKTKTEVLGQDVEAHPAITIGDYELKAVNHFTYVVSTASSNLSLGKETDKMIGKSATTLARLTTRVWENPKLSVKTKMAVDNACVLSTLLFGSETW
ncbi:uncharacterized protein [Branchiostoma lanceolatum]|uniref:uncharacterized protein n=1 Tax=Branchiostoma lanceolatum TaxID=7740 RepID=UPI0034529E37